MKSYNSTSKSNLSGINQTDAYVSATGSDSRRASRPQSSGRGLPPSLPSSSGISKGAVSNRTSHTEDPATHIQSTGHNESIASAVNLDNIASNHEKAQSGVKKEDFEQPTSFYWESRPTSSNVSVTRQARNIKTPIADPFRDEEASSYINRVIFPSLLPIIDKMVASVKKGQDFVDPVGFIAHVRH